jgi:hypothetical protein
MNEKIARSLMYVADAIESGYSSVFTFGVKELLDNKERQELAQLIRELSASQSPVIHFSPGLDQSRTLQSSQNNLS